MKIQWYESLDSTNDEAWRCAAQNVRDPCGLRHDAKLAGEDDVDASGALLREIS